MENKKLYVSDGVKTKPFGKAQVIPATAPTYDPDIYHTLRNLQALTDDCMHPIQLVEILRHGDPRTQCSACKEFIEKEVNSLEAPDAFYIVT